MSELEKEKGKQYKRRQSFYLQLSFNKKLDFYCLKMVQILSLSSSVAALLLLSLGINDVAAGSTCVVKPTGGDDASAIVKAFQNCKSGGTVSFPKGNNYNLKSLIEIEGLKNVKIDFQGKITLSGFDKKFKGKNAYIKIKGDNVHMSGGGTIDGNGQAW